MPFRKKLQSARQDFNSIAISLSSPDDILERSYGEVLKPETINYRSYKPEREGLFCERIFGPVKDFECYCGKYKRIRYKGIVCDKCGVEVTEKKVRRERMGHIKLVVPVVHIWFFKSLPNKIGYLLGLSSKNLELIIYYERFVVIQPGKATMEGDPIAPMELLTEEQYLEILDSLPEENQQLEDDDPNKFIALMGAEAVEKLLSRLDLDQLSFDLRHQAAHETSQQRKSEALKRLRVVEAFREAKNRGVENKPEWTIIKYLPVVPPELRPLVALDGGRFASSDLNDLYRRVIIRNNRLKRLLEIKAPEVILRNEKRMLQEAVDSLFDNSRKSNAVKADGGRPLKSLSDILKGKGGRFRQNLLGKRVDYSGRSVIVVGPTLKLHECGLPKGMASELFKPFIIRKLIERGTVKTVKSAKKLVDRKDPVIWEILENILKGHPVLLNRAPTLHRLSIQAFQPRLIEGKAIQLHPLVCSAFNADFDGDQMAVHVPLSQAAILEAQVLMLSSHNMLNPQSGSPITIPSQDMVLGLYYITKEKIGTEDEPVLGEGKIFYSSEEVGIAFNEGRLDLHAKIHVKVNTLDDNGQIVNKRIETTTGRVLFNEARPEGVPFYNYVMSKKNLRVVISDVIRRTDFSVCAIFLDKIKDMGFMWAYKGGLSFNLGDLINPTLKEDTLNRVQKEVDEVVNQYNLGFMTNTERYNTIINKWNLADSDITKNLMDEMKAHKQGFNSVYMMLDSGARGSKEQIKQLCGLRGLMAKPKKSGTAGGAVIENPILSNFVDGLSIQEYFISTHGARKGLADTALKTADAGYLTRRLVDVAQDVVIIEDDCHTLRGIETQALKDKDSDEIIESLAERIEGRYTLHDIVNPVTDELILGANEYITNDIALKIEAAGIEEVTIRSVLTCETKRGVCGKCYGKNLASGRLAERGDAVGIIAAQSIGEPGTQLTLRTFHVGGIASVNKQESNISSKFDGKIEYENLRVLDSNIDGKEQMINLSRASEIKVVSKDGLKTFVTHHIPYGATLSVKDGENIKNGELICEWDPFNNVIVSEVSGIAQFDNIEEGQTYREENDTATGYSEKVIIESKNKKLIPTIKMLSSDGSELKNYNLPVGSLISVEDGGTVEAGTIIVKIPRKLGQIQDITGGLPRVTELFEGRNPSNPSVVSEIDGTVSFGKIKRGNREVIVTAKDGQIRKYLVGLSKHILVQEDDYVKAGMALSDGAIAPRDILSIQGPFAVQSYLVNGVQEVYRSQGIPINNKHIEVIVRQMMRRVNIVDPGDTTFLEGEAVEKYEFLEQNDWIFDKKVITNSGDSEKLKVGQIVSLRQLREENSFLKRNDMKVVAHRDAVAATSSSLLQGITKSSLGVESWISAASFQETTKVLSTAAIAAKLDNLKGLKENVIVGKKIPAGTGMPQFNEIFVTSEEAHQAFLERQALVKEMEE